MNTVIKYFNTVIKCAHIRFTESSYNRCFPFSDTSRVILLGSFCNTVNASIEDPINFIFRVKRRNWLGLLIQSRDFTIRKTVLQKFAIFSIKIGYVIKIDKYHASIFITWFSLMLKMSVEYQQEISSLMERPWFILNQLISRFYNRYDTEVRSIDVKYWISNSNCINILKYDEYTRH